MMADRNFLYSILEFVDRIKRQYPEIYDEAIMALKNRRVKKYLVFDRGSYFYIVVGDEGDYLVSLDFSEKLLADCTCKDFMYNVLAKKIDNQGTRDRLFCYHIVAVLISFLAEYAFMSGDNALISFRKRIFLPEVIFENISYVSLVFDPLIRC